MTDTPLLQYTLRLADNAWVREAATAYAEKRRQRSAAMPVAAE